MNIHRYLRTAAVLLAAGGLGFGLVGAGVRASFSDNASVTENIKVGTFSIALSTTTPGAVVSADLHSITFTAPDINSSAAGSAPLAFRVTSTGSIPATVTVTASSLAAPFSDLLGAQAPVTLGQGAFHDYSAGIGWSVLGNANMGQAVSITYTISAVG